LRAKRTFGFSILVAIALISLLAANGYAGRSWLPGRHGAAIKWTYNLDEGLVKAKKQGKPVMIDFMALWCQPCKAMEDSTFSNRGVIRKAGDFVPVRIDIDKHRDVAAKYNGLARKYGGVGIPNVLFLASDGKKLKHIVGYYGPEQLVAAMDSALAVPR
jgi:thiol:disulfide interchange protein DsbD